MVITVPRRAGLWARLAGRAPGVNVKRAGHWSHTARNDAAGEG
jgi:hypothetical protein